MEASERPVDPEVARDGRTLRWPLLGAIAAGALITAAALTPFPLQSAYRNPPLHVAFETAEALIASLVAFVLFGRYRESRLLRDLWLVYVLDLFALTNIIFSVIPTIVLRGRPDIVYAWAPASLRLWGAAVLVACAWGLGARRSELRRPGLAVLATAVLSLQVVGTMFVALADHLPEPLGTLAPAETVDLLLEGHPGFMALQAANMLLLSIAAFAFGRRSAAENDELLQWFAAGCVLAAFARLNYLLFPSLYTEYIYTGDVLRLAFYVMFLVGGVREIQSYWASRAAAAVADERRRFARDLHDGAAQELLFILAQTKRMLKGKGGPEDLESLASAADRAVYESRRAINALSSNTTQSLSSAVQEACTEMGRKWGSTIELDAEPIEVSPEVTEHLVRVAREAVTNAVKHGSASSISVSLATRREEGSGETLVLCVEDDGVGFDPDEESRSRTRFGLTSMGERVNILGGSLNVRSRRGAGTTVEVVVPLASAGEADSLAPRR